MKNIFVKWTFTNDYGTPREKDTRIDWFENEAEAEAFKVEKRAKAGAYFYEYKTAEGDFAEFERMNEMMREIEELKKKF